MILLLLLILLALPVLSLPLLPLPLAGSLLGHTLLCSEVLHDHLAWNEDSAAGVEEVTEVVEFNRLSVKHPTHTPEDCQRRFDSPRPCSGKRMSGVRILEEPLLVETLVVSLAVEDVLADDVDQLLDELKD